MSDAAFVAIVGAQSAIIVALITIGLPLLVSTRRSARRADDASTTAATASHRAAEAATTAATEIANDHPKNVRDDLDDKHGEIMRTLRAHGRRFGRIDDRVDRIARRLEVVEDTVPHPRRRR